MKFTSRDAWTVTGGLAILIVLICSFYSISSQKLSEKLIDDVIAGSIKIVDTSTGQPIKIDLTPDTTNNWITFHPVITVMKYIPFIGIVLLTVYIGFFTRFQKPNNPFRNNKEFRY